MYSVIIPCYKSAKTIRMVVETTMAEMNKLGRGDVEFVLVNDCSPDGGETLRELKQLATDYAYVRVIDLAKNVGQHGAVMAGLRNASGDVFISMDDDLQTRPSELHKMFVAFDDGFDVVYGAYPQKKENPFRLFGSWVNKMCSVICLGRPKDLVTSSFWIIRKYVRDSIVQYTGAHPYLLGLILRSTSHITCVPVDHFERESGQSGYTFKTLLKLWSNMIGFTVRPMRIALQFGSLLAGGSFLYLVYLLIRKLTDSNLTGGWASVMGAVFFSLGVLLLFLGLIGEYIGRAYLHLNKEPQYVIRETVNFTEEKEKVHEAEEDLAGVC